MESPVRTEITIETHEVMVVRRRSRYPQSPCSDCGGKATMLTLDEATTVYEIGMRSLFRFIEEGKLHFVETPKGTLLVCSESLMAITTPRSEPLLTGREEEQEMEIASDTKMRLLQLTDGAKGEQEMGDISTAELLAHCVRRPVDELAWREFVSRFHPTIRHCVDKTVAFMMRTQTDFGSLTIEDKDGIIQAVYQKLIENRCQALKRLDQALIESFKTYLVILSIHVAREYLREKPAPKRSSVKHHEFPFPPHRA